MFKVLLKSELDEPYEVPGLTVLIGKENKENPDMELWRPLTLGPGQAYLWETSDPKHEFSPFEKITFKSALGKIPFHGNGKRTLVERIKIETKKRSNWDSKYCPYRNYKYTCLFTNLTEGIWSFRGQHIGIIEVRHGIPKRIPLSPLSRLAQWLEIEIRYHRSVDSTTGKLYPRISKWFGIKKRSKKELQELEKDIELALEKHKLTPMVIEPGMAIDSNLLKEKKSLLQTN